MNSQTFPKALVTLAPYIIGIAVALVAVSLIKLNETQYVVRETSAYTRVSNCIVAKNAYKAIKQSDVEKCYQQVEIGSGVKLERFDNQTEPQPINN